MTLIEQIAKHFRAVHFGGNWTSVNLKDTLAGINWQEATAKLYNLNTIASLVFHRNLHGIIEHTYYHLGQIVLIKKILNESRTVN